MTIHVINFEDTVQQEIHGEMVWVIDSYYMICCLNESLRFEELTKDETAFIINPKSFMLIKPAVSPHDREVVKQKFPEAMYPQITLTRHREKWDLCPKQKAYYEQFSDGIKELLDGMVKFSIKTLKA